MMSISVLATFIGEIAVLLGVVVKLNKKVQKISNGTKCQLRSEMLRLYYHCKEEKRIRQYEYENFISLYEAYKEHLSRFSAPINVVFSPITTITKTQRNNYRIRGIQSHFVVSGRSIL